MQTLLECLGEELYNEMIEKSVINTGCGERLKSICSQKHISLAYLGASITCGFDTAEKCFGKSYADFLKDYFAGLPGVESVKSRNLSVTATNCYAGYFVTRFFVETDTPDIIFVEYAINEESSHLGLEKYESLIRMLLKLPNPPVVIPLTLFNRDGYSCQEFMLHFSRMYGLPTAGLKDSVYPLIVSGRLPLEVYTEDEGHPHVDGHEFIAKCLFRTVERSIEENAPSKALPEPFTAAQFQDLRPLTLSDDSFNLEPMDFTNPMFTKVYKKKENHIRTILEADVECSQLVVMYIKGKGHDYSAVNLFCDGKKVCTFSGHSLFGWNNPWAEIILSEPEKKLRRIRLETEKGEEDKKLYLVALGYC